MNGSFGPDTIGSYRVLEVIGRGGFATVFRCMDDRLEAEVAVKLLADNHAVDPDIRSRFMSEGRILRRIDNRHMVQVHDVGETERGQPYLVLELADRGDLRTRVSSRKQDGWEPSEADVRLVAESLLDAAGALHQNNLIHRDLSPGNVLIRSTTRSAGPQDITVIDNDERLIVADLGFAKDLALNSGLSVAGGTPHFSAPEQFEFGRVSPQSDLYAIARILQWLISGGTEVERRWQPLEAALGLALSSDPQQRPPDAARFKDQVFTALDPPTGQRAPAAASSLPAFAPPQAYSSVTEANVEQMQLETRQMKPADTWRQADNKPSTRSLRWFILPLAAVLVVAAVSLSLMLGLFRSSTKVETIGDNLGRVSAEDDRSVRVDGPIQIPVGRTGVFVATVPATSTVVWESDGRTVGTSPTLRIAADSSGESTVRLIVTAADGGQTTLEYPFSVVEG